MGAHLLDVLPLLLMPLLPCIHSYSPTSLLPSANGGALAQCVAIAADAIAADAIAADAVHPSPRPRSLLLAHLFALLFSANDGEAISSEYCHASVVHVTISAHFSADRAEE
ncbi:hypothetical protein GN244_ATG05854 [Phytophthora infestans]|uniref:Secreted protein n=1 Tax=Phytophthora infestans TaxID=4787 RepID=A0A833SY85_PHYIN|nr:hypothetical protein GN244_ATG05854 [Phytophthora infestans]